ncbi:metallophosphoesterase [Methylobacterium sp. J-067]|uniref:metallophosphoesterase n=1 Tax=Methylobacterium sp. J-067 TaxID=2836648 RepID=UPI001FBB99AE|nr:metallophosphoesterase [Methylobacterium sp. J-067]MCJ2024754.1 metallophosphoesterase [Methylobacterium sp. J-067]
MALTFFTADHHIGNAGILSPRMDAPRPFTSIAEHDETLVACWNAVVRPDDTVWHLGDFAYRCRHGHALRVFHRLNGRKFLVRGNHDKIGESLPWDGPVMGVARIHVQDPGMLSAVGLWLSHYAHRTWPHRHRGDLHLYGHSHGSLPAIPASLDVGVNCWGWTPVTVPQVQARLAELFPDAGDEA